MPQILQRPKLLRERSALLVLPQSQKFQELGRIWLRLRGRGSKTLLPVLLFLRIFGLKLVPNPRIPSSHCTLIGRNFTPLRTLVDGHDLCFGGSQLLLPVLIRLRLAPSSTELEGGNHPFTIHDIIFQSLDQVIDPAH